MFVMRERKRKNAGKIENLVDTKGWAWYYIQALEKRGLGRGTGGRGNLENDTGLERETTVNSEMSFYLRLGSLAERKRSEAENPVTS